MQWFDIHHNSGLISTRMLIDREQQSEVTLTVSARDGGTNPKFATATVSIVIEDENDETPEFLYQQSGVLSLEISENTRVGSTITTVQAVDNDRGSNGSVSYQFSSATHHKYPGVFEIDSSSGDIRIRSLLDRESEDNYQLIVTAKDGGQPSRTSSMTINIDILDVNDNSPVFYPEQYFVVLQSDFRSSEPVVQLRATDADEGVNAEVEYELLDGDTSTFSLNQQSGQIFLRRPISDISNNIFSLTVSAADKKGRKSVRHANVEIVLESDSLRYLTCTENLYTFNIVEDSSIIGLPNIGRRVGQVLLEDNSVSSVMFEIIDGNEDDVFKIEESSGVIVSNKALDREMREKFVLKIRVKSSQELISAICQAEVKLEDLNDETPIISDDELIRVSEDAPIKEIIKIVNAIDGDKDENSRIKYSLEDDSNGQFSINADTGAIYLEKPLEITGTKSKLFSLTVQASDQGQPSLSSNYVFR